MRSLFDLIGRLAQSMLFWWVRIDNQPTKIDLEPLKQARTVVYVLEQQSTADAMVLDRQCRKMGLPDLSRRLHLKGLEKRRPVIALHARPSVLRRRGSGMAPVLSQLLDHLSDHPQEDILLVPVALYWGRGPRKSNSLLKALLSSNWNLIGRFQKLLTILFNGRNTFFELNEPISLRRLAEDEPEPNLAARKVARVLRIHFRRVRTAVIGPDLSHRRVLISQLMNTEAVRHAIEQHAASKKIPLEKAQKLAEKHATDIAADVSYNVIRVLDLILSWLWNRIYNGVEVSGIEPVRELARDHAIVYVPCHRSHMDYLLLSYSLYYQGLNVPHIAAGENLNMPVVGSILRRGGAFFIRRRFGGDKLYTAVFNEYIHSVFSRGYPVEYFIEGGRSRTGRMRHPATGTLAMTVRSHLRDYTRPVVFIPVYIGYEKVLESRSYLGELRGKEKKKENLFDLVKTVRRLKNYGHVYLNFGQPMALNQLLDDHNPDWRNHQYSAEDKPGWLVPFVDKLASQVCTRINQAAALNPINLVALTLLATSHRAIDGALLRKQLTLLGALQQHHPYSPFITLPEGNPDDWIEQGIDEQSLKDGVKLIYPYVRTELFLDISAEEAADSVPVWLACLAEQQLIFQDKERWFAADRGSANRLQLELLAAIMLPTLERYLLTLAVLIRLGSAQASTKELENQSQQMAQRLSVLNGLNAPEFFDKDLFKYFIQTLKQQGVVSVNADSCIVFDDRLPRVVRASDQVVPAEVLYNILQVTGLGEASSDQSEEEMERKA